MRVPVVLCVVISALTLSRPGRAGVCGQPSDALLLLDRSGSMAETVGGQTKWSIAVTSVNKLTSTFAGQINFGLMLFSRHPFVANCSSGKANINIGADTGAAINQLLTQVTPKGDTPLSLSLDEARVYLQANPSANPQYVILVTDGKETCQPAKVNNPPLAASKLLAAGIKTYVVGFGGAVDPTSLSDTAQAGGTGSYYQAADTTTLDSALRQIAGAISCCGDGKLDPGEQCDTAIPAGQPGTCSFSCDDGNPCTDDSKVDKGCDSYCYHAAVTVPKSGDGCCAPGASSATDSDCPPSCGNGVVDPGEKCDTGIAAGQFGGCPTTCDDGNSCTQDTLHGSGCDAYCTNVNTCPTDLCGNGAVDNGEWCDTAIPSGKPGACPKSCDDGNPCTSDVLMGTGCIAKCSHLAITKPASGDGCCPPGASSQNDSDCAKSCGNGVLDPGESCDPGILSGPGVCKKAQDCDDANPCTKDFVGGSACNPVCQHSAVAADATKKDGCCPKGLSAKQDADCLPACDPDSHENCIASCLGVVCQANEICHDGACVPDSSKGDGAGTAVGGCDCRVVAAAPAGLPAALLASLALLALLVAVVAGVRRRRR